MSHALLLRLFLSPSFFNVHVALQYLELYSDNIGITYYLTRRLRELPVDELREVWGFVCHLLITRPSKSRALECFVVETSERSTHMALLTLWFAQAALNDLASTKRDSTSFTICQRVLHQCHEIVFGDPPTQARSPYSSLSISAPLRFSRKKVRPWAAPAIVGIGMVLAGTPAMPALTAIMGEVAVEQGRIDLDKNDVRSFETGEETTSGIIQASPPASDDDSDIDSPVAETSDTSPPSPSSEDAVLPASPGLIRRQTISAARTSPALPLHMFNVRKSRASMDPLGQLDAMSSRSSTSPSQSSPSVSTIRQNRRAHGGSVDATLQRYDLRSQMYLLRGHYCRSELQFLSTLEHISNKLLVIPRPARVSALRAELTALNHKLPAEVCMPLWCSASDSTQPSTNPLTSHAHHRIVRIPPGESVVLNSAERAPYVLMLEVLTGDLDFDPSKRSNRDVLKKIIAKEITKKGSSSALAAFGSPTPIASALSKVYSASSHNPEDASNPLQGDATQSSSVPVIGAVQPPTPTSPTSHLDVEEEEIDVIEQLYGDTSLNAKNVDLSESIVLPPAPKNKEFDRAAWARSSTPSTPNPEYAAVLGANSVPPTASGDSQVLSLEEYSERMRTAAVMLAQLSASVSSGPVAPSTPAPSGGLRWPKATPGAGSEAGEEPKGPLHPSLGGSHRPGAPPAPATLASRSKLSAADAAAIRERIMKEMLSLEEERMARMKQVEERNKPIRIGDVRGGPKTAEDESIIRRELNKADPSAVVFSESWASKKSRIRHESPYGHLASWDLFSCIVKTGGDLRQEQLATQLILAFQRIWTQENCQCWVRYFRILATSGDSGLVETITDAVSIHSIKKAEYARRLAEGRLGHVTLMDHFKSTYGDPSSAKFARAQKNFAKSLAGYSVVTYLLQIKDRHNGNILLDRDGHLVHIDFGFMLSNSPGNIGFEAAPFKLPLEYVEVLGGIDAAPYLEFKRLFREGFEAARKHCDRIITLVELMQKDSNFPCFAALGEQTAAQLRERFVPTLTHSLVGDHVDRLIDASLGSHWTRLYDSFQYYSQSIL